MVSSSTGKTILLQLTQGQQHTNSLFLGFNPNFLEGWAKDELQITHHN